ncbi:hypothetical protein LSAT2_017251 [Lamellibrachia satsuma]|nr:hypothetical protein LSAT2_017251 [Lamellibrachia satsuma]
MIVITDDEEENDKSDVIIINSNSSSSSSSSSDGEDMSTTMRQIDRIVDRGESMVNEQRFNVAVESAAVQYACDEASLIFLFKKTRKRPASNDDDIAWMITVKQHKSSGVSPASTEVPSYTEDVVDSPESPDVRMSSEECNIVIEDAMIQKIISACQSSRLSLETMTYNVCQDVAATIMSSEWQKDLRRDIQRIEPHLK